MVPLLSSLFRPWSSSSFSDLYFGLLGDNEVRSNLEGLPETLFPFPKMDFSVPRTTTRDGKDRLCRDPPDPDLFRWWVATTGVVVQPFVALHSVLGVFGAKPEAHKTSKYHPPGPPLPILPWKITTSVPCVRVTDVK